MFGEAGRLYTYFTYGMHTCANVVIGPPGLAGGVLLRGGEVVEGLELARARRAAARKDVDLARGPARLASALGIALADGGADLLGGGDLLLRLGPPPRSEQVATGPRVGVSAGGRRGPLPVAVLDRGEPTVSQYAGRRRRRAPTAPRQRGDPDERLRARCRGDRRVRPVGGRGSVPGGAGTRSAWAASAYGGRAVLPSGRLPTRLRVSSALTAVVLLAVGWLLLLRGGVVSGDAGGIP